MEYESESRLIKDPPYLAITGELWSVYCEDLLEKIYLCYNGTSCQYPSSKCPPVNPLPSLVPWMLCTLLKTPQQALCAKSPCLEHPDHSSVLLHLATSYVSWSQLIRWHLHIDGLVQERRNSSALAMELCLFCTNPSICKLLTAMPTWM